MLNSYWQLTFDHLEVKYLSPASTPMPLEAPCLMQARKNAGHTSTAGLAPLTRQSKAGGL